MAEPLWSLTDQGAVVGGDGLFRLHPRRTDDRIARSPFGDGRFVLREWTEYILQCQQAVQVWRSDHSVEKVAPGLYLLSYENAVGLSQIVVYLESGNVVRIGVDVVSRKLVLDSPAHPLYQPVFLQRLISAIAQHLADASFEVLSSTQHRVQDGTFEPSDIFLMQFLRSHADELSAGLRGVVANPHRVLEWQEEVVPVGQARRVDVGALQRLVARGQWERVPSNGIWTASDETGYAPKTIDSSRTEESFDTAENRFVLMFASHLREALPHVKARLRDDPLPPNVAGRLTALEEDLHLLLGDARFTSVSAFRVLPTHSQVLLRREGYEALYRLYPSFLAGRTALQGLLGDMIAMRDIAHLYELWCFLEVARQMADQPKIGKPRLLLTQVGASPSLRAEATFPSQNLSLLYHRSFDGPGQPRHGRSYSAKLVPDITVFREGRAIGVFDAKFRLRWSHVDSDFDGPTTGKPLEEDLHKMHAYRDALHLRFAASLYPGDRAAFFPDDGVPRAGPHSVVSLVLDDSLQGVGAIRLRPGEVEDEQLL